MTDKLTPEGQKAILNTLGIAANDLNEVTVGVGAQTDNLVDVDAETLIEGYHHAHKLSKLADIFKVPFREALLAGKDIMGVLGVNGAYSFKTGDAQLEARPRHKTVLNRESAVEVLKKKSLLGQATESSVKPMNLVGLRESLEKFRANLAGNSHTSTAADELRVLIDVHLPVVSELSEKKIEALVENKDLDAKDVKGMFDIQTTWALFDVTP